VLTSWFPEMVERQPEVAAYHYTEAGLTNEAIDYWQRAGQQALQRSAYAEAMSHLTRAFLSSSSACASLSQMRGAQMRGYP
jgi:predicted ATPase